MYVSGYPSLGMDVHLVKVSEAGVLASYFRPMVSQVAIPFVKLLGS